MWTYKDLNDGSGRRRQGNRRCGHLVYPHIHWRTNIPRRRYYNTQIIRVSVKYTLERKKNKSTLTINTREYKNTNSRHEWPSTFSVNNLFILCILCPSFYKKLLNPFQIETYITKTLTNKLQEILSSDTFESHHDSTLVSAEEKENIFQYLPHYVEV